MTVIRKNVNKLTAAEKSQFVAAVKAIKASGQYDKYVMRHAQAPMANIHRSPAFLPWHRQFLLEFEHDLQQASGNSKLALPYWNWAQDAATPDPKKAPIWADDFLGGDGDSGDGGIVKSGPFRQGQWTIVNSSGSAAGPLRRQFGQEVATLPSQADVNAALSTTPYDAAPWSMASNPSFRNRLEGWYGSSTGGPGLHNRGHVWVGGSMLPMTSPNDPSFFLHHCFVDKIWADWQARHSNLGYVPTGGAPAGQNLNDLMEPSVSGSVTPASVLNIAKLGYQYDTELGLAHAMWTHGHSAQIEYPDRIQSEWRPGFYLRVEGKPSTNNWIHFAIPTSVIVDNRRLRVGSVMLRYRTTSTGAYVHAVHVYDGRTKIASHDQLKRSPQKWAFHRFEVPYYPEVRWGLGISIGVGFDSNVSTSNRLEISSAGCDFLL